MCLLQRTTVSVDCVAVWLCPAAMASRFHDLSSRYPSLNVPSSSFGAEDKRGQEDRLLQMQDDVALVHEEIGMAPRSQCNSRAGSRMHSLSNSVHNSPALGPEEKDILGVVPVVLTPAAHRAREGVDAFTGAGTAFLPQYTWGRGGGDAYSRYSF